MNKTITGLINISPKTSFRQKDLYCILLHIINMCEEKPKLSQETIWEIKEARENIKKGSYYTEEEAKKILGL